MLLTGIAVGIALVAGAVALWWRQRVRKQRQVLDAHTIAPEELHGMLSAHQDVKLFDVRLPLDLLAYSEIIPGAQRIAPKEVIENPFVIPRDKDTVIYCTCPDDKTSRMILRKALDLGFFRLRILSGGLEAWKVKGFPVERYEQSFHLDTPG